MAAMQQHLHHQHSRLHRPCTSNTPANVCRQPVLGPNHSSTASTVGDATARGSVKMVDMFQKWQAPAEIGDMGQQHLNQQLRQQQQQHKGGFSLGRWPAQGHLAGKASASTKAAAAAAAAAAAVVSAAVVSAAATAGAAPSVAIAVSGSQHAPAWPGFEKQDKGASAGAGGFGANGDRGVLDVSSAVKAWLLVLRATLGMTSGGRWSWP